MSQSETFAATGSRVTSMFNRDNGTATGVSGSSSGFGGGVSLAYDALSGGYTVRDANGSAQTFLPSSRSPGDSNATITAYTQAAGNRTDQLVLFNTGASNPRMALSYVSYGAWQRLIDNNTTIDVAQQYFVYGIRQGAAQPSTGSASYATIVDGLWSNAAGIYTLGGTSSFTANFSNMTVATQLNLTGQRVGAGPAKNLGLFTGTGTIAALGGGFNGTFQHQGTADDGSVYTGGFAGAFFGPQGQEVGYTFSLTAPGGAAAGAVVGKAN